MWHILRAVLLLIPRIIISYFAWMLSYSRKNTKTPIEKRYQKARRICNKASSALKLDILVEGKENIPLEACCFYSNHMGAADPLLYFKALDKPVTFVAKKEIEKLPFVGRVFRCINGQFLDRADLKQSLRVMMKVQESLSKKEISWVIFPEGTRNKDHMGTLLDFHHGTFRAANKAKVPLVPTVVFGSFRILNAKHSFKKYPTYIKFLKPIYPDEYEGKTTEEIAKIVQSRIQAEVSFQARKIDHTRMVELRDSYYRFNRIY